MPVQVIRTRLQPSQKLRVSGRDETNFLACFHQSHVARRPARFLSKVLNLKLLVHPVAELGEGKELFVTIFFTHVAHGHDFDKRLIKPSLAHHAIIASKAGRVSDDMATVLILTFNPASFAAARPRSTWSSLPPRVTKANS